MNLSEGCPISDISLVPSLVTSGIMHGKHQFRTLVENGQIYLNEVCNKL